MVHHSLKPTIRKLVLSQEILVTNAKNRAKKRKRKKKKKKACLFLPAVAGYRQSRIRSSTGGTTSTLWWSYETIKINVFLSCACRQRWLQCCLRAGLNNSAIASGRHSHYYYFFSVLSGSVVQNCTDALHVTSKRNLYRLRPSVAEFPLICARKILEMRT